MNQRRTKIRLSRLELEIMRQLWQLGSASIREILESLQADRRPEYTTVQTIVYRLEEKGAVLRFKKIGNAHIFRPLINRKTALGNLIEDFMGMLGDSAAPLMAHLVETGRISLSDLRKAEQLLAEKKDSHHPQRNRNDESE